MCGPISGCHLINWQVLKSFEPPLCLVILATPSVRYTHLHYWCHWVKGQTLFFFYKKKQQTRAISTVLLHPMILE